MANGFQPRNSSFVKEEQSQFLRLLGQPPARLDAEQVAWALGCQPHDVPVLVKSHMLKPLGNPPPNSVKSFATAEVLELARDTRWLAKMTNALSQHWQRKNASKKAVPANRQAVLSWPTAATDG